MDPSSPPPEQETENCVSEPGRITMDQSSPPPEQETENCVSEPGRITMDQSSPPPEQETENCVSEPGRITMDPSSPPPEQETENCVSEPGRITMDPSSPPPEQKTENCVSEPGRITELVRLRRFLCYGSESATYRAREEQNLSLRCASSLTELLEAGRGREAVQEVRGMNLRGAVRSSGPTLFALAVISQYSDVEAKRAAYSLLREVCPSASDLFCFVQYKKELSGAGQRGMWGRALRKAVADWYNGRDGLSLARDITKCRRKGGWSHQDLFRLSHLKPANDAITVVSKYVTKGWKVVHEMYAGRGNKEDVMKVFMYLEAVERAKHSFYELEVVHLIEEYKLEREHVPAKLLKSREVWRALLKDMSIPVLLSHLGKMTADRMLDLGSPDTVPVCKRIWDGRALLNAKTHPLNVLLAAEIYMRGYDKRGKSKWNPNRDVIQALDSAFYKCFPNVESTGKRFVVGVDVSSQQESLALGSLVKTVTVAAAMSMMITRSEPNADVVLFSEGAVVPCTISADSSLPQITMQLMQVRSNCTNCALPIQWASENDKMVDVFVVFTNNNETGPEKSNLAETLRTYRQKTGIFSKLIVCGMTTNSLDVIDPDDRGMLETCGFDSHTVTVIHNFITDVI
ncbi:60 kDa SS-A/Ro ribonucleoprotein [Neoarius graeffei]|uniref:60 kDa SS-A/Ro ribonucleoprotein n=1 Tax=Neoarius graeffei TaxID=443677 RepID=UPI00298D39EA|nr:60 kDa SS-A/Ro ribonucleoprotein [Neoarius graeffei]XP_060784511.1 60 kDa SS-A/Ro ribonucleoprotein [Neoarius graeffei]